MRKLPYLFIKKKLVWDERFIRRLTAISRSDNFWLYSTVRMCFSSSMLTLPSEFTSAFSKNFSQAASHLTNLSAIVVFANFCIKYSWNTKILSSFYPLKCFFCLFLVNFFSLKWNPSSQSTYPTVAYVTCIFFFFLQSR